MNFTTDSHGLIHLSFKGSTIVQCLRRSKALRAVQKFNLLIAHC